MQTVIDFAGSPDQLNALFSLPLNFSKETPKKLKNSKLNLVLVGECFPQLENNGDFLHNGPSFFTFKMVCLFGDSLNSSLSTNSF